MRRGFGSGDSAPTSKPKSVVSSIAARPQTKVHTPSAAFEASDTSVLKEGDKVEHQKFGFGKVQKMEGASYNPIATIVFEQNGEKKIMLNYAKLRIIAE
jgi:DNA helicase-2/ATP-dependent DNA helicase PcrA